MLHSEITQDPDVAQAVEDKLADLAEIRDLIAADARLVRGENMTRIGELFADFYLRAERLQVEPDALIQMVGAELDRRKGRFAIDGRVRSRLTLAESRAIQREHAAQAALTQTQQEARLATSMRAHAQMRCLALGLPVTR